MIKISNELEEKNYEITSIRNINKKKKIKRK